MPVRTLIIALLTVAVLSGCGRRGPLEEPGAQAAGAASNAPAGYGISPLDPGAPAVAAPSETQPQPAPRRRFFLDFLL